MIERSPVQSRQYTGVASELAAAAYLVQHQYSVFRSVSQHSPFDLVAYRDGTLVRVEVKGTNTEGDYISSFAWPRNTEWDLLIVVVDLTVFVEIYPHETIDTAKAKVRSAIGLPPSYFLDEKTQHRILKLHAQKVSQRDIAREVGRSLGTVNRVIRNWPGHSLND